MWFEKNPTIWIGAGALVCTSPGSGLPLMPFWITSPIIFSVRSELAGDFLNEFDPNRWVAAEVELFENKIKHFLTSSAHRS